MGPAIAVDGGEPPALQTVDEGGDPACWAHILCPEFGAVLEDGIHPQFWTHTERMPPTNPREPELIPTVTRQSALARDRCVLKLS